VNFLRRLALKKKIDDSSRLDVVEIARIRDMLPSLFPSWSGLGTHQDPGTTLKIVSAASSEGQWK